MVVVVVVVVVSSSSASAAWNILERDVSSHGRSRSVGRMGKQYITDASTHRI